MFSLGNSYFCQHIHGIGKGHSNATTLLSAQISTSSNVLLTRFLTWTLRSSKDTREIQFWSQICWKYTAWQWDSNKILWKKVSTAGVAVFIIFFFHCCSENLFGTILIFLLYCNFSLLHFFLFLFQCLEEVRCIPFLSLNSFPFCIFFPLKSSLVFILNFHVFFVCVLSTNSNVGRGCSDWQGAFRF